ncbi:hypothetical protein CEXT_53001 [Caerostris extrusa]|uniref:Uncharacterized protein n=1 Tax=Caerostris extrusa TaxID=172846 RepID=A0AAV4XZ15_CAEEX|nr:hypothetical protein CEXT_53001 [Caerostris extrusa]
MLSVRRFRKHKLFNPPLNSRVESPTSHNNTGVHCERSHYTTLHAKKTKESFSSSTEMRSHHFLTTPPTPSTYAGEFQKVNLASSATFERAVHVI